MKQTYRIINEFHQIGKPKELEPTLFFDLPKKEAIAKCEAENKRFNSTKWSHPEFYWVSVYVTEKKFWELVKNKNIVP